ncbi:hypothetical protein BDA96_03G300600 [Sorghum bicolor]|uniref:Myb/SANT-like DNA-binding domain-containing protein n=1 Tax=Sorghum bicolor TaxID=4558 RepID=A0A921RI22_SORBI|nr:hypothetical protein BDA96_03G300600 [Sorghum bicolor]
MQSQYIGLQCRGEPHGGTGDLPQTRRILTGPGQPTSPNNSTNHEPETLAAPMSDDAAAAASPSPSTSPSPSSASSSGASPSPSSPRTKRRRTDRYALGFEFAPRLAPYELPEDPLSDKPKRSGPKWTERSTFALLDAWGDSFVRAGRSIIRADEWLEVARRVCAAADRPAGYFSDSQCRNRVDTLRKKFKKERERARLANRRSGLSPSKWVYYDKMVSILCPSPLPLPLPAPPPPPPPLPLQLLPLAAKRRRDRQPSRCFQWGMKAPERLLGGGGDVVGPRVSGSGAELGEREPQKNNAVELNRNGFVALTESIQKFEEVFARMERSKRQQMLEVEQMRRDLHRDLDAKWREILEKAQVEIARLSNEDGDEGDSDEDGDVGDDKRLEDDGAEQNNGAMDASP